MNYGSAGVGTATHISAERFRQRAGIQATHVPYRGGPEVLILGTGHSGQVALADDAEGFLAPRLIECRALPTPEAIEAYNQCDQRKAALVHVTC